MTRRLAAAAALIGALIGAGAARAQPGLANKVYDPYVRNGLTEFELRTGRLTGGAAGGDSRVVTELEHGFTDRISGAVLAEFEDEPGERRKLDSIAVESVIYLGQIPKIGVDVGGYLEYEQRIHNESGVGEAKLLLAKQFGRGQALLNLIAERPFTSDRTARETEFGYAALVDVEALPRIRLGVEAFGDLGTDRRFGGAQAHFIGPVAKWEVRPRWLKGAEIEVEAAYLAAAGAARRETDGQARLLVELEKRF